MHRPAARKLNPSGWIDEQRAAGDARGNIFLDILSASREHRMGRQGLSQAWIDRRNARVEDVRREAAEADSKVELLENRTAVPSFSDMVDRWKAS